HLALAMPDRRGTLTRCGVLTLVALGLALASLRGELMANRSPAEGLDWVASRPELSQQAWVVIAGEERHRWRYFERRGHDTGRLSFVADDEESLDRLRSRIAQLRPPQIVALGFAQDRGFDRYTPDARVGEPPAGIQVFRFEK
ncbi:MAG: hypothetical protein KDB53_14765, partial [Planctomycetes bacterium]|nr:hypothetical protein [Planctomycetota bacterium]